MAFRRLFGGGGDGSGVTYILRDEFTTDEANPIASPRTCEPGPGTLTVVDGGNFVYIRNGMLFFSNANASNDPSVYSPVSTVRTNGLCFAVRFIASATRRSNFMSLYAAIPNNCLGVTYDSAPIYAHALNGYNFYTGLTYVAGVPVLTYLIHRLAGGGFVVINNAGVYKLCLATRYLSPSPLGVGITKQKIGSDLITGYQNLTIQQLGSPWNADAGPATQILSGARSPGDTFTHEGNCYIVFTVAALPSSNQIELRFRMQDTSNYWQVTIDSSGNLDLDEVVAGTPTQRGTSAGVIANGDYITIIADSTTILVNEGPIYSGTNRISYASATNFATETDGELETEGTGGSVTDIEAYPRNLSGAAATELANLAV